MHRPKLLGSPAEGWLSRRGMVYVVSGLDASACGLPKNEAPELRIPTRDTSYYVSVGLRVTQSGGTIPLSKGSQEGRLSNITSVDHADRRFGYPREPSPLEDVGLCD